MKKTIALILAALLALSMVSALAAEYTDKETVKKVQQALNDMGFDCGTPDGAAGKKTRAAITDYQSVNGMEPTGTIDDALLSALGLYQPIADWGGAGATVPLTGFGHALAKGVEKAVAEKGWLGILTGGLTATSGGIAAAVVFGVLAALLFKAGEKR